MNAKQAIDYIGSLIAAMSMGLIVGIVLNAPSWAVAYAILILFYLNRVADRQRAEA